MKRRMWALTATVSAVVTIGGALTGVGLASQPDGPALTNVPTANTKSDGYSPASRLSPELSQVVVAQVHKSRESERADVLLRLLQRCAQRRPAAADAAAARGADRSTEVRAGHAHASAV